MFMNKKKNKKIEKIIEKPARMLDTTVRSSKKISRELTNNRPARKALKYWNTLGPGLVTGAADDDPSGIQTYSQTGAAYGYQFTWLALFSFPFMGTIQEMCARIGIVTGRGLAENIKKHFSKPILYTCTLLLFIANTFNIGVDLGAMAKVTQLVFPFSNFSFVIIAFTIFCLFLVVFVPYKKYARYLKWLSFVLLAYIVSALMVGIDWKEVHVHLFVPTMLFTKDHILIICAILGTTISPYLFFWEPSQEVEEEINIGRKTIHEREGATKAEIHDMRVDNWFGMFFSNIVMFFIIVASAVTLHAQGIFTITTLAETALALKPIAGDSAYALFALGVIGTGLLAIPVLASSASYAISESFGWKEGLYRKLRNAYSFYGIIILSMCIGFFINFLGIDPVQALIYSAVTNGIIAPIIIVFVVLIAGNKKIMGRWSNGWLAKTVGWALVVLMGATSIATVYTLIF